MSKASEYAKSRSVKQPRMEYSRRVGDTFPWTLGGTCSITDDGDLLIQSATIDDAVIIQHSQMPALIKWLQDTFID